MTNDNAFDDFDTTITAEEFYEADYLDLIEEAPGDTTDEPPYAEADYDDLAIEADRDWNMYPHDLDGYEHPEFDA